MTLLFCRFGQFLSGDERLVRFDLVSGDIRPVLLKGNPKSLQKARIYKIPEGYPYLSFRGVMLIWIAAISDIMQ
jgi:hypothetical protein